MEVALAPEIEQAILAKVTSGEYSSVAALVEEALFLLVERDWLQAQRDLRERTPFALDRPEEASSEGNGA